MAHEDCMNCSRYACCMFTVC